MVKNKKGVISLVLIIIFVVIAGLGGYAYYKGNKANPNSSFTSKLTGGLTKVVESVTPKTSNASEELNYKFNFGADFETSENKKVVASGTLNIKNGELITLEQSLKQSLKIGELSGEITEKGETKKAILKDIITIGDEEIVYLYMGEGYKYLIDFYKTLSETNSLITVELVDNLEKAYKEKKYIKINNSKPVLRILGKLSEKELIKKIVIGLVTSNPKAYFEKYGVDKELKEFFATDGILNYIFKDGEYNEETKKTFLTINDQICSDISPIIGNIAKEFGEENMDGENIKKECITGIKQANGILPMIIQIYKEGNIKSGNYKFIVSQGIILKLEIDYKKHILDTYSLELTDPGNKVEFAMSGNKGEVKSSLFKINIDENSIKINGEIKNGTGKINIEIGEEKDSGKGFISFEDYKLGKYDFKGESEREKIEFVAKGDIKEGKISIKKEKEGDEENILLEYSKGNFLFDVNDGKNQKGKIVYKDKIFDLDFNVSKGKMIAHYEEGKFNYLIDGKDQYQKVTYDNGKITGKRKYFDNEATLKGEFRKMGDFDFEFNEEKQKINIIAKAEKIDENTCEFNLIGKEKNEEKINININRKTGEKDGFKTCELKGKVIIEKGEKEANFNMNYNYKKGGAKFEIPKDAEELDIKITEIATLPDFNVGGRFQEMGLDNVKIVVGGVTVGIIGGVFVAGFINGISEGLKGENNYQMERNIDDMDFGDDKIGVNLKEEVSTEIKEVIEK